MTSARRLCGLAGLATLLLGFSVAAASAAPAQVNSNTNLRQGPGTTFGVVAVVPGGSVVHHALARARRIYDRDPPRHAGGSSGATRGCLSRAIHLRAALRLWPAHLYRPAVPLSALVARLAQPHSSGSRITSP